MANITVFDRLNNYLRKSSSGTVKEVEPIDKSTIIFKTKDKETFETKKKEYQQNSFLKKIWHKAKTVVDSYRLMNETKRIPSYIEYENMDEYGMIHKALDIYAEESTTVNDKGEVLNIKSNNSRIKEELRKLFFQNLNINSNIFSWTRNLVKNGDEFLFLDLDNEKGVIGCKQLPTIEVERVESDLRNYFEGNRDETTFKLRSNFIVEFKNWQMAHFRLLSDSKRLPYGVSMLEGSRRVWKNLILVEDAMRTIKLIRATDRRVFYIDVGNIDNADVSPYVNMIADNFKRKKQVDPETGQQDLKYNVMGIDQDYFIPVRGTQDGTKIDTLAGQTNTDIADVEYDRDMLAVSLGIAKSILNFSETIGDGKSMAMLDIRFARTVNRIQLSIIEELNKIAIVHLTLLGLEEYLDDFSLTLNNPSIQAEILKTDLLQSKIQVYNDLVNNQTGSAAMSKAKAKKLLFTMNDDEIISDLVQQRLEKAIDLELLKTEQIITKTGLFDEVDALYGTPNAVYTATSDGTVIDNTASSGGGGGGGGFDLSDSNNINDITDSQDGDVGDATTDDTGETPDDTGGIEPVPETTPETAPEPIPEPNLETNSKTYSGLLLIEKINKLNDLQKKKTVATKKNKNKKILIN